jgi:hypothetical protein
MEGNNQASNDYSCQPNQRLAQQNQGCTRAEKQDDVTLGRSARQKSAGQ